MRLYDELIQKILHGHNPYSGYPSQQWSGTWYNDAGACRSMFHTAIDRAPVGLLVEVGSFVGESTVFMANHLRQKQGDNAILCIDTWLGGIDHWEKVPEKLRFHFGRPSLYYQFLGNIIEKGVSDLVVPLTLDSLNAARLLKLLNLYPSMVYVDASHEGGDVLRDYEAYWELLVPGGIMLVDDLTNWFPPVVKDFETFVSKHNLKPEIDGEKGLMVKA